MKKIISCLVAVCMAAMSFVTVHCEDNIKVILDGKTLEFDVQPQIAWKKRGICRTTVLI